MASALQFLDVVEVGAVKVAVDRQHEECEHLTDDAPGVVVVEGAEGHEVDVDRREHELDAHQHEHRVLAREHAEDASAEEERAQEEELVEEHQSRLASTTAPTSE